MAISVTVQHNFQTIGLFLKGFSQVAVKKAAVQAMNRTALTARKEAVNIAAKRLALPKGGRASKGGGGLTPPGLKSMFDIQKARYSRSTPIRAMFATLNASEKPISLIHFVKGPKAPRLQLGIPVKNRKPITVEITKGRKIKLKSAFIAKSRRGGAVQVFRRDNSDKMRKQSVPSIYVVFNKPEVASHIRAIITARYKVEFPRQLAYYAAQVPRPRSKPK